jgi:hypothetical protein
MAPAHRREHGAGRSRDGALIGSVILPDRGVQGAPLVGLVVYIGSADGYLYALQ